MVIFGLVVGAVLLLAGKHIFWFFVAIVGFFVGMNLAERFFDPGSNLILIGGVVLGVVGALLAIGLQRVAVLLGGFLAGGYLLSTALGLVGFNLEIAWLPFVIGGLLGAALLSLIFDWALVILSSLLGAMLITQATGLGSPYGMVLLVALFITGVVVQQSLHIRVNE